MADPPAPLPLSAFDYLLPAARIARYPVTPRDASRLLVLQRNTAELQHRIFRELPDLIDTGDVLVLNETRVIPARLRGRKSTGARAEVLLLHPAAGASFDSHVWEAMVRPGAKLRAGSRIEIAGDLAIDVLDSTPDGGRIVRLLTRDDVMSALARHGEVPLPPYIDRAAEAEDRERYQTVYAQAAGSVAAPTAGLHFTPALLDTLAQRAHIARLVLHVGPGTFRPVESEDIAQHPMHPEWYQVSAEAADTINRARAAGGKVWAVGTTVVRTLETVAEAGGTVQAGEGTTSLFLRPPHTFLAVDRLITNFHLPRSTLLMLVAAFGGYDAVMAAYREAVAREYRFYSFGDAMVVL